MSPPLAGVVVPIGMTHESSDGPVHCFSIPANGMKLVWVNVGQGQKMVVHRLIRSGSQCEDYTNLGATHALEHFFFKDGAPWLRFAAHGANLNAYTSTKWLVPTAEISIDQLKDWLTYQGECMRGEHMLSLTKEQIASEIRNVVDELNRDQSPSNLMRKMITLASQHLLLQGNTVPTIGKVDTLYKISTAEDVHKLQKALLGPSRNTLLVVGQCDPQELLNHADSVFGNIPRNENLRELPVPSPPTCKGMSSYDIRESAGATAITFAWPSPAYCKDTDALEVIMSLLSGPPEANTLTSELVDHDIIYQIHGDVSSYDSPDIQYLIATIPTSKQTEPVCITRAQLCLVQSIMSLQSFDDQSMLNDALQRVTTRYENSVHGGASAVADACSSGIKSGLPSLAWHYKSRFSPTEMTTSRIREAAGKYLTEHNLCMVRYMQNTLPPMDPASFPLTPSFGDIPSNPLRTVHVQNSTDPLAPSDMVKCKYGMRMSRDLLPATRSHIAYVFPRLGIKDGSHNWGNIKVFFDAVQHNLPTKSMISRLGTTIDWQLGREAMVVNLDAPASAVEESCKLFAKGIQDFSIDDNAFKSALMRNTAMTNGSRFDASLLSNMAYANHVYDKDDYNYILPIDERIRQLKGVTLQSARACSKEMQSSPQVYTCVSNMTEDQQAMAWNSLSSSACKRCNARRRSCNAYAPTVMRNSVLNTPSCNVVIAQPCSNVDPRDASDMARLNLACTVLGNGFVGRLMTNIRDKLGLTYSIAPRISISDTPSILVHASFNPSVLASGTENTTSLLNNWCADGISQSDLDIARDSILGSYSINSLEVPYVMTKMVKRVCDPYDIDTASYYDAIRSATLEGVNHTLRNSLRPDQFSVSIAGSI